MSAVLIVTLGPIQDLIAAARRTRDLWFGSWLLSELSKATARAMAEECGPGALVFPAVDGLADLAPEAKISVANKIVIRVPQGKDPATVAERGRTGMRRRLEALREEAFQSIAPEHFERSTAEAQVGELIEFSWVSAAEQGAGGYAEARRRAELLLGHRKNTRLWGPVRWGLPVPKSSIDGERESVLHEDLFDRVGQEGGLTAENVRKRYGVGPTERLCGVGLLKRRGTSGGSRYEHRFLSTGHLAAWPVLERAKAMDPRALQATWREYLETLERGGVNLADQEIVQADGWEHPIFGRADGSLLFESRLPELFEEAVTDPELRRAGVLAARRALTAVLKEVGVASPLPYYAILVADGDHMGDAIRSQDSFPAHRDLSRALAEFARGVRSTVENLGGELVYAGGDDVLAFVPLHRAVDCAKRLEKDFRERLSTFPVDGASGSPTLSAGIGIAHFLEPLRRALDLARKAETLAKVERDSLAVILDKRSGPPLRVSGKWGSVDRQLTAYVELHRTDHVPDGAAYELQELARLVEGTEGDDRRNLEDLVKAEAKRILRRKQPEHGGQATIDPEILAKLDEDLEALPLVEVADRLIVARLLAQAEDEATPPKPLTATGDPS